MTTTAKLYADSLSIRQCAQGWEPGARLLGNVTAAEIAAVMSDYAKLRLAAGISDEPPERTQFDRDFNPGEQALVPVLDLEELERARINLFEMFAEETKDTVFLMRLTDSTSIMWRLANRKHPRI